MDPVVVVAEGFAASRTKLASVAMRCDALCQRFCEDHPVSSLSLGGDGWRRISEIPPEVLHNFRALIVATKVVEAGAGFFGITDVPARAGPR